MTDQLALDTDPLPALQPGDWTLTGWGEQHRIRRTGERWTELVCHTTILITDPDGPRRAGESNRCETARIRRDADETGRCPRCSALPDLGPLVFAPVGEVRRSLEGVVVVAHTDRSGRSGGRGWKVIGPEPEPMGYGWRSDWEVARWERLGNVFELPVTQAKATSSQPRRPGRGHKRQETE